MPERKIDWNQLMEEALTMPGNMQGVYDRFYPYSLANIILLRMQGVREPIATYKRWQRLGRQVLRGATAKEIIVPLMRKVAVEADDGGTTDTTTYHRRAAPSLLGNAADWTRPRVERPHGVLAIDERDGINEKNPRPRGGRGSNMYDLVRPIGFEPTTFGFGSRHSIQLSYGRSLLQSKFRPGEVIEICEEESWRPS